MYYFHIFSRVSSKKGFTLLLAALVGSIVLAVGTAIYSIAQKQITLSGVGRDSQFAFYAADTGLECAQYWDQSPPIKNAAEDPSYFGTSTPAYAAMCDGKLINRTSLSPAPPATYPSWPSYYTTSFQYDIPIGGVNKYCVQVTVTKAADPSVPGSWYSRIHADGYNVTCASLSNPRALQRSSELCFGPSDTFCK